MADYERPKKTENNNTLKKKQISEFYGFFVVIYNKHEKLVCIYFRRR